VKNKKKDKRLAHANMVWERSQLKAAIAAEQIDKAVAAVEQYKEELSEEQFEEIKLQVENQKKQIEDYLIAERNKYAAKLDELNIEAVIKDGSKPVLVNLEDL
jgi:DNA-binding transcriptional regulator GbsR (MarR family)